MQDPPINTFSLGIKIDLIRKARKILGGEEWAAKDLSTLYKDLVRFDQFGYAAELLQKRILGAGEKEFIPVEEYQELTKFIYKDQTLPSAFKFEKALNELQAHDPLNTTSRCETLGLAGAIYKRKWQYDHQFKNLIFSRYYYKKGYDLWKNYLAKGGDIAVRGLQNDKGFTAINYAYINELMSVDKLEEHGKVTGMSESMDSRLKEAEEERKYILHALLEDDSAKDPVIKPSVSDQWTIPTVAEAFFGLRRYDLALKFINESIHVSRTNLGMTTNYNDNKTNLEWEMRTFQVQLFSLAYLQLYQKKFVEEELVHSPLANEMKLRQVATEIDLGKINECLAAFSLDEQDKNNQPEVKKDGKLGLALSGGGFRASLYHIGVLAALAEHDQLRQVEVISCVSGGSIIGAYYYLRLKSLLETKKDKDITQPDYIELVKETEKDFLRGVQYNLRIRLFTHLPASLKMLFNKNYSRTHRMGELYERFLFKPVWKKNEKYAELLKKNDGKIFMSDLRITPHEHKEGFDLNTDNWKRRNKVPQLVLNATSVNTGHNWQFTASWMGEPPGNIQPDIDVKPRLRRMYYEEAPEKYRQFRLGYAVGASSCVPVMFRPMPMFGLYEGIDLQLIDGGLHDNQGIAALIEQECRNMIISDASGQMPTDKVAANNEAAVFYRADNILQERLRELQFMDIKERNYTTQLNKLVNIHLKKGLQQYPVQWIDCDDPVRRIYYSDIPDEQTTHTAYGILLRTQTMLSEIRTDLDSFNDMEAYALMYSGYRQVLLDLSQQQLSMQQPVKGDWQFLTIEKYVTTKSEAPYINKQLMAGKKLTFKVMDVSRSARITVYSLGFIALGIGLFYAYRYIFIEHNNWKTVAFAPTINITVGAIATMIAVFLAGFFSKLLASVINYKSYARKKAALFILILLLFVITNFYIFFLNGIYNRAGSLKKKN